MARDQILAWQLQFRARGGKGPPLSLSACTSTAHLAIALTAFMPPNHARSDNSTTAQHCFCAPPTSHHLPTHPTTTYHIATPHTPSHLHIIVYDTALVTSRDPYAMTLSNILATLKPGVCISSLPVDIFKFSHRARCQASLPPTTVHCCGPLELSAARGAATCVLSHRNNLNGSGCGAFLSNRKRRHSSRMLDAVAQNGSSAVAAGGGEGSRDLAC